MLLDNLQAGVIIHSADSSIMFCNPVAEKLLGLSLEQMQGKVASDPYWRFIAEDGKAMSVEQYSVTRILSTKKALSTHVVGIEGNKINGLKWLFVNGYPVFDENKQILRVVISFIDITESKRNEKAILESENKHKAMIANISDVIGILDKNGIIKYNSLNTKKWFGWEPEDLIDIHALRTVHPDDIQYVQKEFIDLLKQPGFTKTVEYRNKCKDGSYKYVHLSAINLMNDKNINGILVNYRDITEQKKAEDEIKKFRTILDKALYGNVITDLEGNIIYINDYSAQIHGYVCEELIGQHFSVFYNEKQLKEVKQIRKLMEKDSFFTSTELGHIHKDGTEFPMLMSGNVMMDENSDSKYVTTMSVDITKQKRLEKEKMVRDANQVQQQRLESIGKLAGGVAHEINNPINGIMNYSQLILDSSEIDDENAGYAKEIIFESERIATIVKNLLQFSRQEKQAHSYADIETIITNTLSLIKTIIRHDQIDLQIDIPKDLPKLKCRNQQIQQVIMNLLTNARDALNEKYQGYNKNKIIKLYCEQFIKQNRKWIRIIVEDHGNGITKSVQEKLFEPFFTTKERDKGTGLGLPISYGIVKEHHGELTFDTEEGSFTRFYLELPCDNGWELE